MHVTTDGLPLTGFEAADALRAFWAPIFKAKLVNAATEDELLRHIPEK